MKIEYEDIQPTTQHDYAIGCLEVEEWLLGRTHKFERAEKMVTIRLPTKGEIDRDTNLSPHKFGGISSYRLGSNGEREDATYAIYRVIVSIQMSEIVRVPVELPTGVKTPYAALSDADQKAFKRNLKAYGPIANEAFRYWLRVMRWKTGEGLLGRGNLEEPDRTHSANVVDPRNNKTFGTGYGMYTIRGEPLVRQEHWTAVRPVLRKGTEPPVWAAWIAEGEVSEANGNIQGAVAYFAIACESFLLAEFFDAFPQRTDNNVMDIIERQISGRAVIERFAKSKWPHLNKKDWSRIHDLFNVRNKVVHSGYSPEVSANTCTIYRKLVRKLLFGQF